MSKVINGKLISDELVEEYENALNEYNRLYDIVEGANDYGDNIVNGDYESKAELNNIEKRISEIEYKSLTDTKITLVDNKYILESDLDNYNKLKEEYNYYYDLTNGANDYGDNVVDANLDYNEKLNELEKELNDLETKATLALKTETIDGKEILISDIKDYQELKEKYNDLYDRMNGAMDMGDNVVNGEFKEEQKELDELYEKIEKYENKANFITSKINATAEMNLPENNIEEVRNNIDNNENVDIINLPENEMKDNNEIIIDSNNENEVDIPEDNNLEINNNEPIEYSEKDNINDNDIIIDNEKIEDYDDSLRARTEKSLEKIKETLTASTPKEELQEILNMANSFVMQLYYYEQELFEQKLKKATTVEEKLDLIEKREQTILDYAKLYESENLEVNSILLETKKQMMNYMKTSYKTDKSQGEYIWKEKERIVLSKKYIDDKINVNQDSSLKFNTLIETMENIIKQPEQKEYENWLIDINNYTNNLGLQNKYIVPYLNARAKIINPDLNLDNNFNIHGLGLNVKNIPNTDDLEPKEITIPKKEIKKIEGKPPVKSKLKVKAKKALNWMKEHKLVTIGLGLALTTLMLWNIPITHMMINSSLWWVGKTLGWNASTLESLHGINVGLAKGIKGGKYVFEGMSGSYTLSGAMGAEALYKAGSANLITAITGLTAAGGAAGIGGALYNIGKSVKNKIQNSIKKRKQPENIIEIPEDGYRIITEKNKTIDNNEKQERKIDPKVENITHESKKEQLENFKNEVQEKISSLQEQIVLKDQQIEKLIEEIQRLKQTSKDNDIEENITYSK